MSSSPEIQFQMSTAWKGIQKYIPTISSTICIIHPCTGPIARRHSMGVFAAGWGSTTALSFLRCTQISAPAIEELPGAGRCSSNTIRSCEGSSAKSLICTPKSSTTNRLSPRPLPGNHDATSLRAAPNSSSALANSPPTSSYAWQCPASATEVRRFGRKARQAARRSSRISIRAAVVDAKPPGWPFASPSEASSMRYWRARDVVTRAWSCLQTFRNYECGGSRF